MNDSVNKSNENIKNLYKEFFNAGQVGLLNKFEFSKEKIVTAKGCLLFTESGKEILDLTSGFGTQNLGYNNTEIINERINFVKNDQLPFSRLFFNENIANLAEKMSSMLSGNLKYSFFSNSGAEANEGALKLAYKYHEGNRKLLIHNKNSFHGKLIATSQITDSPEVYFDFQNSLKTLCLDLEDLSLFEKTVQENLNDIYAVILEPFSASLAKPLNYDLLLSIQDICKQNDIVVIFDEVYSGFYRTSNLFYFMNNQNLAPDIITYSKSFGGGIASISGYTSTDKVFLKAYGSQKDALLHSSTYSNYVEESKVALKSLEIFSDKNFLEELEKTRNYLTKRIQELEDINHVVSLSGDGFHWGLKFGKVNILNLDKLLKLVPIEITQDPRFIEKLYVSAIINYLYVNFDILSYAGFNAEIKLFISPPLIINNNQIDHVIEALKETIEKQPVTLMINFVNNYLLRLFGKG